MESNNFNLTEKLRGAENWVRWKWAVEGLLLEREGAWEVCVGELKKPEPLADGATETAKKKYEKALQSFDKGNRMARGVFARTLDTSITDLVTQCKTAKEIWDKLHDVFEQKNVQAQYATQMQFANFVRDEKDGMAHHIAKLDQLTAKMQDLEIRPTDFVVMCKLLETLPKDFEPLKQAWGTRPAKQQTLAGAAKTFDFGRAASRC